MIKQYIISCVCVCGVRGFSLVLPKMYTQHSTAQAYMRPTINVNMTHSIYSPVFVCIEVGSICLYNICVYNGET